MAALFSCYYVFSLVYQEEASSTLEFIQRCFIGINPTSGTKMTKWISPRSGKVHKKRNNSISKFRDTHKKLEEEKDKREKERLEFERERREREKERERERERERRDREREKE
ncbi:hypothetical protein PAMA_004549 [Pampus argenteus]